MALLQVRTRLPGVSLILNGMPPKNDVGAQGFHTQLHSDVLATVFGSWVRPGGRNGQTFLQFIESLVGAWLRHSDLRFLPLKTAIQHPRVALLLFSAGLLSGSSSPNRLEPMLYFSPEPVPKLLLVRPVGPPEPGPPPQGMAPCGKPTLVHIQYRAPSLL